MSTGDNPSSASQPETVVDKGWPRSDEVVSGLVKHFETLRDDKPHDPGGKRPSPSRQLSLTRQLSISVDDGLASSTTGTTRSRSAVPSIVMELCESDDDRESKVPVAPALRPPTLPMSSSVEPTTNLLRKSPVTVQEWVDSIPASQPVDNDPDDVLADVDHVAFADDICPTVTIRPADTSEVDGVCSETAAVQRRELFSREASPSLQSDTGSHTSSVDSFLDARRPDPEELLLSLGFGGSVSTEAELSRIPARFLQPSRVKGININDFLRYQQDIIDTFETGFCGYRGLTGMLGGTPALPPRRFMSTMSSPGHGLASAAFYATNFPNIPPRFLNLPASSASVCSGRSSRLTVPPKESFARRRASTPNH